MIYYKKYILVYGGDMDKKLNRTIERIDSGYYKK